MSQQLKNFIELILNRDNLPVLFAMLIAGILTFVSTYQFFHKPVIAEMDAKIKTMDDKLEKKDNRIREIELVNLELNKQGSNLIVKDGKIEQSQNVITGLNQTINKCAAEKTQLESKLLQLKLDIEQKDKIIANFNVNEPILIQIKQLQKERYDLLHSWMISSKTDEQVERRANELNDKIIEMQKSITCKS